MYIVLPELLATSMSILLAATISSVFSVNRSARRQMISLLWENSQIQTSLAHFCQQEISVSANPSKKTLQIIS